MSSTARPRGWIAESGASVSSTFAVPARPDVLAERVDRHLLERLDQHPLVVFGGVRGGVAGPQDPGEPRVGAVEEAEQRVEAEAALPGAGALLLPE
jgi:hypothetical protein